MWYWNFLSHIPSSFLAAAITSSSRGNGHTVVPMSCPSASHSVSGHDAVHLSFVCGFGGGVPFVPPANLASFVVDTGPPMLKWHPVSLPQPKHHVEQCGATQALQHAAASGTNISVNVPDP